MNIGAGSRIGTSAVVPSGKGVSCVREFRVLSGGGMRLMSMGVSIRRSVGTDKRRWRYRGRAIYLDIKMNDCSQLNE